MKIPSVFPIALLIGVAVLQACAGSAPDFQRRTPGGANQEAKLAAFIRQSPAAETGNSKNRQIDVPLCSSTAGHPVGGWAIDAGDWCVVSCRQAGITESRWVAGTDGKQCLAAPVTAATSRVTIGFSWSDLSLQQQDTFDGLSRSFLSDTEWHCKEFDYLIDPDTNKGFWSELESAAVIYRFHRSGKLLTGRASGAMKLGGSWSVNSQEQVFFNSAQVFKYAIDYGGGRFDNFKTTTKKQVCRYVSEADLPA